MDLAKAAGTQVATTDLEAEHAKINGDRFKTRQHLLVNDKLKSINIENLIRLFGLIQSQGQSRTTSSTRTVVNPNGCFRYRLKIFVNLFGRRWRNGKHLHHSFRN